MAERKSSLPFDTVEELIEDLGGISPRRIRLKPPPGTATEADLLRLNERKIALCELVNGTLVEKPVGYSDDGVGSELIILLGWYVRTHDLGIVGGAQASMRLAPGTVRLPDVHFIS